MKHFFVVLLSLVSVNSHGREISCSRPMNEQTEMSFKNCATKNSTGEWIYKTEMMGKLNFEKNNLAPVCINITKGCHWVNRNGKMVEVLGIEGTADSFSQGLARHIKDEKIGFIDESLNIVIPPQYDAAFQFTENKTAVVCTGCKKTKTKDTELSSLVGGEWYLINKAGKVVKNCGTVKEPTLFAPANCAL